MNNKVISLVLLALLLGILCVFAVGVLPASPLWLVAAVLYPAIGLATAGMLAVNF